MGDRINVLILHDKPAEAGGIRRHVEDSASVLRAAGHEVRTLRLGAAPNDEELVFPPTFGWLGGVRQRGAFRRLVRSLAPEVIHFHAGFTSLSAVLLRELDVHYPTVGQFHDVGSFCYLGTRRYLSADRLCDRRVGLACWTTGCYRPRGIATKLRGIARALVRADLLAAWRELPRVVAPSRYLRDVAVLHGFDPSRVRVVANFRPPPVALARQTENPPLILFVGSMLPIKGAHLVLAALARVTDHRWRAIFVGDGIERANLERQCRELGLTDRVSFAGSFGRKALDDLYGSCQMLVHASVIPESFGLVGIEAMSQGVPVVGFDLGGVREWLVDGETGIAVTPWSAEALAEGIRRLLEDPAMAARLGQAARARTAALFGPQRFLADTLSVYAETIETWRKRRKP